MMMLAASNLIIGLIIHSFFEVQQQHALACHNKIIIFYNAFCCDCIYIFPTPLLLYYSGVKKYNTR